MATMVQSGTAAELWDEIERCERIIEAATKRLYRRTGLTVKYIHVKRFGEGVAINAAIGIHVPLKREVDDDDPRNPY